VNVITFLFPYYNEDRGSDSLSQNINVFLLSGPTSLSCGAQFRPVIGGADVFHISRSQASRLLHISLGSVAAHSRTVLYYCLQTFTACSQSVSNAVILRKSRKAGSIGTNRSFLTKHGNLKTPVMTPGFELLIF
jgi:hypothetical protein